MVDVSASAGKSNRNDITSSNTLYADIVVQQSTTKPIANNENRMKKIRRQNRILRGTSPHQRRDMKFAAGIDLVAYGVYTQVTGNQLSKFIENKGIKVLDCVLLTKYEHARALSYNVTIKACDYEKSQDPSIWCPSIQKPKKHKLYSNSLRSNEYKIFIFHFFALSRRYLPKKHPFFWLEVGSLASRYFNKKNNYFHFTYMIF